MSKQKYYVVWQGKTPGIYTSWDECKSQVSGVVGAKYKSFKTKAEATAAFSKKPSDVIDYTGTKKPTPKRINRKNPPYELDSLAVDAACSGNPGKMEYRGIYVKTGQEMFHSQIFPVGTNNLGEFLAIVQGLVFLKKHNKDMPLYTDSRTALSWVRKRKVNSTLPRTSSTAELWNLVDNAVAWLKTNTYTTPIVKWESELWGEVPADFGRK